jgi:hypothetical protein
MKYNLYINIRVINIYIEFNIFKVKVPKLLFFLVYRFFRHIGLNVKSLRI